MSQSSQGSNSFANDDQLFDAFRSGDEDAFRSFCKRFAPLVLCFSESMLQDKTAAESIVSEVFYKLFHVRHHMLSTQHVKRWLLVVARNCCNDYLRETPDGKQKYMAIFAEDEKQLVASLDLEVLKWDVLQELVQESDALSGMDKWIFTSLYIEDKPLDEVARELNLQLAQVEEHSKTIFMNLLHAGIA